MSGDEMTRAEAAERLGLDPLMEKTFWELVTDIPKRLAALITKALGKEMMLRIVGAWIATDLMRDALIADYVWLIALLVLIFGKQALDVIKDVRK
ncbi:MAG: hypothetical protein WD492_12990 [Alkalispirochaeta sp.]